MTPKQQILYSKPQFICLVRIASVLIAFALFPLWPLISLTLMVIAEALDMVDGYLARKYQAVSAFGTIADMLIDRLTPIFCFTALIILRPQWAPLFSILLAIDLLGHMAMIYCALLTPNIKHHKQLFQDVHWLLKLYYANSGIKKSVMVLCIFFYDLAMMAWIVSLLYFDGDQGLFLMSLTMLGAIKVYVHFLHIYYSFQLSLNLQ